jgi:hypothetical protein
MGRSVRLKLTTLTVASRLSARFHKSILGFFLSKTTSICAASKQESLFMEALLLLCERLATIDQITLRNVGIFAPFFSSALVEREPPPTIVGSSHSSHCPN